jgi:hypothetical protein
VEVLSAGHALHSMKGAANKQLRLALDADSR